MLLATIVPVALFLNITLFVTVLMLTSIRTARSRAITALAWTVIALTALLSAYALVTMLALPTAN